MNDIVVLSVMNDFKMLGSTEAGAMFNVQEKLLFLESVFFPVTMSQQCCPLSLYLPLFLVKLPSLSYSQLEACELLSSVAIIILFSFSKILSDFASLLLAEFSFFHPLTLKFHYGFLYLC